MIYEYFVIAFLVWFFNSSNKSDLEQMALAMFWPISLAIICYKTLMK